MELAHRSSLSLRSNSGLRSDLFGLVLALCLRLFAFARARSFASPGARLARCAGRAGRARISLDSRCNKGSTMGLQTNKQTNKLMDKQLLSLRSNSRSLFRLWFLEQADSGLNSLGL